MAHWPKYMQSSHNICEDILLQSIYVWEKARSGTQDLQTIVAKLTGIGKVQTFSKNNSHEINSLATHLLAKLN